MPSCRTDPDAFDARPGDLLTIVELDALETMAALQVLEGHVSDEGAVVQLHHGEALLATGTAAQSSDAIICDQLAVGQGLPTAQEIELKTQTDRLNLTQQCRQAQTEAGTQSDIVCLPVLAVEGSGLTAEPGCYLSPEDRPSVINVLISHVQGQLRGSVQAKRSM